MRISTSSIYNANVSLLNQQQAQLLHTQQQIATQRRILTPADDPIASARALEISQADASNSQYAINRNTVQHSVSLAESILQSVTNLLQDVRTIAVNAGNGGLNSSDKQTLATDLSGRLEELLTLANSTDGIGNYLFSGFQGRTQPFSSTSAGVQYQTDDGQRMIQVSSSRQLAASDSGADIFMRVKDGNGTFNVEAAAANTGSGIVSLGATTNPALLTGNNYQVTFSVVAGVTTYGVTNITPGALVPVPIAAGTPYVSGQVISFDGLQFDITGAPASGDVFTVAPSTNESIFKTIANLITALRTPNSLGGEVAAAEFTNSRNQALNSLDRGIDNVLTVRASLGTRLSELEALQRTGESIGEQYKQTLSQLQDLDFNKAISDLTQQKISLEAAQKSFLAVSELSLFNYM
ncbi:MAG: flagellar hook-associated protein FlgL [Candidatus Nitrotoga sp.]|nr:flagellar hook-associated protein FlgL [Candidatus Nitrotoga sp.]MDO9446723.1 flagellar hook-associated protein FlgL [Candidatus Nitrotoga sp.]MDP1638445.1 flagellar hook-associated protein FlgL [Candidatus Nitrotoga sp.]MDP1855265.1 flagellar hook-associated protein FlgL [Candidatus Nitrotoga sp.]MDP3497261.1 flagellar hook-associated protein FlgL [Candidatus Nitrotoga sp.]